MSAPKKTYLGDGAYVVCENDMVKNIVVRNGGPPDNAFTKVIHPCNCTGYNGGQCYNCLNGLHSACDATPKCDLANSSVLGLPIVVREARKPIVRGPNDRGYRPPVTYCVMECGQRVQRGDILCAECRSAVGRY